MLFLNNGLELKTAIAQISNKHGCPAKYACCILVNSKVILAEIWCHLTASL